MKKPIKKKLLSVIPVFIFIVLCLFIGILSGQLVLTKLSADLGVAEFMLRMLEIFAILISVALLQILMHEAGHMLVALMRGWTFLSFMFLNVIITRYEGKFRVSRYSIPGAGGQCLMIPPLKGDTDFGIMLYNAGGIIINAIIGTISAIIFFVFFDSLNFEWSVFFMMSAFVGILFALINAVPMKSGGIANDGMNMLELKKDKFSSYVFLKSMRVVGTLQKGGKIGDELDSYLTDGVDIDFDNPIHVMALNLDLCFAMSELDFEKASVIIQRAVKEENRIIGIYRDEFKKEKLFLSLIRPDGSTDVDKLLDDKLRANIKNMSSFRPDAVRIDYAVALLHENDKERAAELYDKFNVICSRYHSRGDVENERRLIEEVRKVAVSRGISV